MVTDQSNFELPCASMDEPYWGIVPPNNNNSTEPVSYSLYARVKLDDWIFDTRKQEAN